MLSMSLFVDVLLVSLIFLPKGPENPRAVLKAGPTANKLLINSCGATVPGCGPVSA